MFRLSPPDIAGSRTTLTTTQTTVTANAQVNQMQIETTIKI